MFSLIIFISLSLLSVLGYGIFFKKYIFDTESNNIGELGLFGFFLLFFISLIAHFFIPLSYWFNLPILIFGLLLFLINFKNFKEEYLNIKIYFYILSICILPALFFIKTPADFETYHLPYINYLNEFKIIFGLVNISNNYAYGHGWLDILGLFSIPYIENKGATLIALLFLYFFFLYLITEIVKNESIKVKFFSIIALGYTISNFSKVENLGAEAQSTLLIIIIFLNVLKYLDNKNSHEIIINIFFYFFYALILRIGSLIIVPIIIVILILNIRKIFLLIRKYVKLNIFFLSFFLVIIFKNFIVTGCFVYPIPISCPNYNVSWANPIENTQERYEFISAITKRWKFYILDEANIKTELDYYEPMEKNIILSPKEYNDNKFFWINYFFYDHDAKRILNTFLIIFFCFISFLIFSKKRYIFLEGLVLYPKKNNFVYFGIIFASLMWLFLSPQMRYGGYGVIGGSLIFLSAIILSSYKIERKNFHIVSVFLIFISSFYFITKNITRITDHINSQDNVNLSVWPKYNEKKIGIDYKKITINNNIELNLILTPDNIIKKPIQCGNLKMLCLPEERLVCVSEIKVKNGYYFISNNNKECLIQFQKNYWQH